MDQLLKVKGMMDIAWKKSTSIIRVMKDEYLLYNTLNGAMAGCTLEHAEKINAVLENPNMYIHSPIFDKLVEYKFILDSAEDVYQIIERKFHDKYVDNSYMGLTIMPTEQCNFRCVYCYEDHLKPKMKMHVQKAIVEYVEQNIDKHKGLWVEWFGGEPLLAMDVVKYLSECFLDICKRHNKPYKAGMTTNGYFLNHETFKQLYNYHVWHYQITIDGSKKIHDMQRPLVNGAGSFDRIVENLKQIRDNDKHRLWGITLRTNVSLNMLNGMNEYLTMLKHEFSNDRRFTFVLRKMWSNNTECSDEIVCADDMYNRISQSSLDNGFLSFNDYQMSFDLGYVCYAAKPYDYVIGSDGKFYKCTVHLDSDNNHVGSITDDGKVEFYDEKLAMWNTPNSNLIKKCKKCSLYATCVSRSCPAKGEHINCAYLKEDITKSICTFKKMTSKYLNLEEYV